MTGIYSVVGFIAKLKVLELEMNALGPAIVAHACELVAAEARRVLGTEGYDWPALSAATLAHKMQSGMLLESGKLRASIQWNSEGNQGWVGSDNDKAIWHEFGTSKIPPRPFLAGAAAAKEDEIHRMARKAVVAVMLGKGLHSSEMAELLHLLHTIRHVGHAVGEAVDTVLDGPEDEKRRR
jgi:phage gpG-like protein